MNSKEILTCDFDAPTALVFNTEIPSLVYFTHIPVFIIAFLLGLFVLYQGPRRLSNRVFFFTMMAFGSWVFLDAMFWAANRPDYIMMIWTMLVLIEPLVHIGMLYMMYIFVNRQDMPFSWKVAAAILFLPQIVLVTSFVSDFDIVGCLPRETMFSYYSYLSEIIFITWILGYILLSYKKILSSEHRNEVLFISIGLLLFLFSFTGGNIYGSFTGKWEFGALGLLGIMLFSIFMAYSIVRFQTFNTKIVSAQVLVVFLVALIGSQLTFADTLTQKVISAGAFALSLIFSYLLVRSVKQEVERKEELQDLAVKLAGANQTLKKLDASKSEFISIASHQLRTPLTGIKGYLSLMEEGTFGEISPKVHEILQKLYKSNERIINLVEDLLSVSRIESGRMQYKFEAVNISDLVLELSDMFKNRAQEKGLEFSVRVPVDKVMVRADEAKMLEVISNLVDNGMKYTNEGFVHVEVKNMGKVVHVIVSDSGIGIPQEMMSQLFQKFQRGEDQSRLHVDGTGLGLYVGKNITEDHDGKIIVASEGVGKGSTLTIELPALTDRQVV